MSTPAPGDPIATAGRSRAFGPALVRLAWPSLALAAGGLGTFLRNRFQRGQLYGPDRYPLGFWQPESYGLPAEDVWFSSEDDVRLHAWWVPHGRARGTVLYCHGNNGNISHRIGVLAQLRRLRLNVLAFDYRGYGRSEGEPSEEGLYQDVRAAHDLVTGPLGQVPSSILLFGHSLGGAVAIDCALHREVAGLVVQSSFTQVRDVVRTLFPGTPLFLLARNQFRSIRKVGQLSMPKLFIHGTDDPTVPHSLGRRLYEEAADPKEWYPVPRAGHNELYRQGGFRYYWRLHRFVSRSCRS